MKRLSSRRTTRYAALLLALVVGAVVVVASAQATPTKKNVNAYVFQAKDPSNCTQPLVGTCFEVLVQNDNSSNVTLGSTNVTAPTGWAVNSAAVSDASGHNWNACGGDGTTCGSGSVVQLRANTSGDSLTAGQTVTAFADVTTNCTASGNAALWSQETKQANNFSGQPGNDFLGKNLDLNPLGGFTTNSISSPVILTDTPTVTFTATALDTCGQTKATGTKPGAVAYTGASPYSSSVTAQGLTGVHRPLGFTWGSGTGTGSVTVSPTVSQFNNQFTVADTTTGISATSLSNKDDNSNTFDVFAFLCTSTNTCHLNNGSKNTTIDAPTPTGTDFLGLGFDDQLNDSLCAGSRVTGASVAVIAPSVDLGSADGFYQVTFTYTKQITGSGPASGFVACYTQDEGQNWIVLQPCSKTQPAPCVANQSRTTGGALKFIIDFPVGVTDPGLVPHH